MGEGGRREEEGKGKGRREKRREEGRREDQREGRKGREVGRRPGKGEGEGEGHYGVGIGEQAVWREDTRRGGGGRGVPRSVPPPRHALAKSAASPAGGTIAPALTRQIVRMRVRASEPANGGG